MTKPLTKEQIQLKKIRRLKDKNLENLLLYRFLNHYGYDKGPITAKAIIRDILKLIMPVAIEPHSSYIPFQPLPGLPFFRQGHGEILKNLSMNR